MHPHTLNMMLHDVNQYSGMGFGMPRPTTGVSLLQSLAAQYASPIGATYMPESVGLGPLKDLADSMGPLGSLAAMLGESQLRSQFAEAGLIPYGNAGSFYQAQDIERYRTASMYGMGAGTGELETLSRIAKGALRLTGVNYEDFTPEQVESFDKFVSGTSGILGMASMLPGGAEALDSLMGSTGSPQAMAMQMLHSSRFQLDPTTGRMGVSGENLVRMRDSLFDEMYLQDNTAERLRIGAGGMGSLYSYLQTEGLLGRDVPLRDSVRAALGDVSGDVRRELLQETSRRGSGNFDIDDLSDLDTSDLLKLAQSSPLSDGVVASQIQASSDTLKGYTRAVAAIRELFGENGINAPFPELLNSLKALTNNQLHRFSEGQLTSMVNDITAVTRSTGLNVDQIVQARQTARNLLTTNGVSGEHAELFVGDITMSGIMAGAVTRQNALRGFGVFNEEEARFFRMNLDSRAVTSEMANNLAALRRLDQADPDLVKGDARAVLDAALAGETHYINEQGNRVAIPKQARDFTKLVHDSDMDLNLFTRMVSNVDAGLQTMADTPEIQQAVSIAQSEELRSRFVRRTVQSRPVADRGITEEMVEQSLTALEELGKDITNQQDRTAAIRQSLIRSGIAPTEASAAAVAVGEELDQASRSEIKTGIANAITQVIGVRGIQQREAAGQRLEFQSQLAEAVRPLGKSTDLVVGISDALKKIGDDPDSKADIPAFLQQFLGTADATGNALPLTPDQERAADRLQRFVAEEYDPVMQLMGELEIADRDGNLADAEKLRAELSTRIPQLRRRAEEVSEIESIKQVVTDKERESSQRAITDEQAKLDGRKDTLERDSVVERSVASVNFPDNMKITGRLEITGLDKITQAVTTNITQADLSQT